MIFDKISYNEVLRSVTKKKSWLLCAQVSYYNVVKDCANKYLSHKMAIISFILKNNITSDDFNCSIR